MNVTLKNIKIAGFASQETLCFTATIYIDGNRSGIVENAGRGGPNRYTFTNRQTEVNFQSYCESLPPIKDEKYGNINMDSDIFISQLIEKHEIEKRYKSKCKNATLFRLKSDKRDTFRIIKTPFTSQVKAKLVAHYGENLESIINEIFS